MVRASLSCSLSGIFFSFSSFQKKKKKKTGAFSFQKIFSSSKVMTAIAKCPVRQSHTNPACPLVHFPAKASLMARYDKPFQTLQKDSTKKPMNFMNTTGVYPKWMPLVELSLFLIHKYTDRTIPVSATWSHVTTCHDLEGSKRYLEYAAKSLHSCYKLALKLFSVHGLQPCFIFTLSNFWILQVKTKETIYWTVDVWFQSA